MTDLLDMPRMVAHDPAEDVWAGVLRETEALSHSEGWDLPTHLYWVDDVGPVGSGFSGLGVRRPAMPEILGRMAPDLLLNTLAQLLPSQPRDHSVAVVVVFEVVAALAFLADAVRAVRPDTPLVDVGGVEVRVAMLAQLIPAPDLLVVFRVRGGQDPTDVFLSPGDLLDDAAPAGAMASVAAGLRRLAVRMATVRGHQG